MTGLWFEYVWHDGYTDSLDYKCGMWTILKDKEDYIAFNSLKPDQGDGNFAQI